MFELIVKDAEGVEQKLACIQVVVDMREGLSFVCKGNGIGQHQEVLVKAVCSYSDIIGIPETVDPEA